MTTDIERREATDQWTISLREQQLRDLQAQLAAATQRDEQRRVLLDDAQVLARDAQRRAADAEIALDAATDERNMLRGQLTVCCIVANGNAKKADRYMAERDAANTETEEQAWEIAKLRYYVESLERLLTPEQRQEAATEANAALALHNPPVSVQPRE